MDFLNKDPANPRPAILAYVDPCLRMSFFAGTANGVIVFDPASTVTQDKTVFQSGNLAPIVQNAPSQMVTGNLTADGATTVGGAPTGNGGGAFKGSLTLDGSPVLTQATAGAAGSHLPLSGGTITGDLGVNGNLSVGGNLTGNLGGNDTLS